MASRSKALDQAVDGSCAIARCLGVLNDSWSFLLLREAFLGRRTFAEFRDELGIATDVLSAHLGALVEHGVFERVPYQVAGQRTRDAYALTAAGQELKPVLVALQQWGEAHIPSVSEPKIVPRSCESGRPVHVSLVADDGSLVRHDEAEFVRVVASETVQDTEP